MNDIIQNKELMMEDTRKFMKIIKPGVEFTPKQVSTFNQKSIEIIDKKICKSVQNDDIVDGFKNYDEFVDSCNPKYIYGPGDPTKAIYNLVKSGNDDDVVFTNQISPSQKMDNYFVINGEIVYSYPITRSGETIHNIKYNIVDEDGVIVKNEVSGLNRVSLSCNNLFDIYHNVDKMVDFAHSFPIIGSAMYGIYLLFHFDDDKWKNENYDLNINITYGYLQTKKRSKLLQMSPYDFCAITQNNDFITNIQKKGHVTAYRYDSSIVEFLHGHCKSMVYNFKVVVLDNDDNELLDKEMVIRLNLNNHVIRFDNSFKLSDITKTNPLPIGYFYGCTQLCVDVGHLSLNYRVKIDYDYEIIDAFEQPMKLEMAPFRLFNDLYVIDGVLNKLKINDECECTLNEYCSECIHSKNMFDFGQVSRHRYYKFCIDSLDRMLQSVSLNSIDKYLTPNKKVQSKNRDFIDLISLDDKVNGICSLASIHYINSITSISGSHFSDLNDKTHNYYLEKCLCYVGVDCSLRFCGNAICMFCETACGCNDFYNFCFKVTEKHNVDLFVCSEDCLRKNFKNNVDTINDKVLNILAVDVLPNNTTKKKDLPNIDLQNIYNKSQNLTNSILVSIAFSIFSNSLFEDDKSLMHNPKKLEKLCFKELAKIMNMYDIV